MESVFELTKQNLKIIKKKSSLRRLLIADTVIYFNKKYTKYSIKLNYLIFSKVKYK